MQITYPYIPVPCPVGRMLQSKCFWAMFAGEMKPFQLIGGAEIPVKNGASGSTLVPSINLSNGHLIFWEPAEVVTPAENYGFHPLLLNLTPPPAPPSNP